MPIGCLPTEMVVTTLLLEVLITITEFSAALAT